MVNIFVLILLILDQTILSHILKERGELYCGQPCGLSPLISRMEIITLMETKVCTCQQNIRGLSHHANEERKQNYEFFPCIPRAIFKRLSNYTALLVYVPFFTAALGKIIQGGFFFLLPSS